MTQHLIFNENIKSLDLNRIWANSHLWSVSKFLFDFLGPNYGLFKKIEPEFGQNFRHDHNQPCTNWS